MTVQRRRRDSYKKAIVDILAVDAEAPLSSISEQLKVKFPNPPHLSEDWIKDAVRESANLELPSYRKKNDPLWFREEYDSGEDDLGDMEFTKENINSILRDKYFRNAERDHERRNRKDYRRRVRAYNAAQVKQEPT